MNKLVAQYNTQLANYMPKNSTVIVEPNYEAYGPYAELFNNGIMRIDLKTITLENYEAHFKSVLSILLDGIETDQVQKHMKIYGMYSDGIVIPFSLFDYFINMIFWILPLRCGELISSNYFIFEKDGFTQKSIKRYIDTLFLERHRSDYENNWLNNTIDESIYRFIYIDQFSDYICNTFNNEDTIMLMKLDKQFYDATHLDVSGVPIEQVKKVGETATDVAINRIKESEFHFAAPFFKSGQGINKKQYRQFQVNIGTEPDGSGGVYPAVINSSYSNGGAHSVTAIVMEAQVARLAQIFQKNYVGMSGMLARHTSINNIDTKIYPDLNYFCNTKNLISIHITDEQVLKRFPGRYFKLSKNGMVQKIPSDPMKMRNLIGKTIMLYSPMTCVTHAMGLGYCRRCYGDLAYTNYDINPGKFAAEELTSQLTQKFLSAKHILEANVIALNWVPEFLNYFMLEGTFITLIEDYDYKKFKLIINAEEIEQEDDIDSFAYNEFVKTFKLQLPNGAIVDIHTEEYDDMTITPEFTEILSKKKPNSDGEYVIELDKLDKDTGLFVVKLYNVELTTTLNEVIACIDKQKTIDNLVTLDAILQKLIDSSNRSGLDTMSVHCEVLLSNQVRRVDNILENPEWEYENEPYQILTLKSALTNNPSIGVSLEFSKLPKVLRSPLSYKKKRASVTDLFYMIQPQNYMSKEPEPTKKDENAPIYPFIIKPDPNQTYEGSVDDEENE